VVKLVKTQNFVKWKVLDYWVYSVEAVFYTNLLLKFFHGLLLKHFAKASRDF